MLFHHFSSPDDLKMFNIPSGAQQPHKIPCKRCVFHPKFPFVNVIKFILTLLLTQIFQAQNNNTELICYIFIMLCYFIKILKYDR